MMKGKNSFVIYDDWKTFFDSMDDEHAGKMIKALFAYRFNGEIEVFANDHENAIYRFMITTLDRDAEKYQIKCEQARANIQNRYKGND